MELIDPRILKNAEREAERLCEVLNELDRLERTMRRPVLAREIASALGWSTADLAEEVLALAVEMGCAVDGEEGYRLG